MACFPLGPNVFMNNQRSGLDFFTTDEGFNDVDTRHAAITCVKDIATARVETCKGFKYLLISCRISNNSIWF